MSLSNAQRSFLIVVVAVLLVSLTVAAWAVAKWGFARSKTPAEPGKGITVSDSAQVKVQPDTAFVTFGVRTMRRVARDATQANANKTTAVIAALVKAGIARRDIQTIDYSLEPEMNWRKNPPVVTGYSVSNSVQVRTKYIGKLGDLLDAAVRAGANNVQGVRFDVEDKKALRQKAIALAVKKAEGKARAMAAACGAKIGPVISASEVVGYSYGYSRNAVLYSDMLDGSAAKTPIEPGETSVSAQVKVVYSVQ